MAKNNYLSRFFLCLIAGLCVGIGSLVIGVRYWFLGDRATGIESFQQSVISCQLLEVLGDSMGKTRGSGCDDFINEEDDLRIFVITDSKSDWMNSWLTGRLGNQVNEKFIRNNIKQIYTAEIGVREKTGKNDGERVEEYLAVTQLGKGYAWCAAFVSWVFAEAGFPEPRTPWSPSLFPKKRVIWERGITDKLSDPLGNRVLKPITPRPADVFGIYFANLKRIAHVGFVDEWGDKQVITVEGNTNEAGSAEGDGVYRKRRPIGSIYQVSNWVDMEVGP